MSSPWGRLRYNLGFLEGVCFAVSSPEVDVDTFFYWADFVLLSPFSLVPYATIKVFKFLFSNPTVIVLKNQDGL